MIPTTERIDVIARLTEGSFEEVPFGVLLHALAVARRDVTVTIKRRVVHKEIVLCEGVPVQCASNLAHETLGRFLIATGKLTAADEAQFFAEAVARGVLLGRVLVDREVVTAEELERLLQHNLARRLLDGFTWRDGVFSLRPRTNPVKAPLPVNVGQLILLGVSRFAPTETISRATARLIGKRIARNPTPPLGGCEPCPAKSQRLVLDALGKPQRLDELVASTGLSADELSRAVVALLMAGLAVLTEAAPAAAEAAPARPAAVEAVAAPSPAAAPAAPAQVEPARVTELDLVFVTHQRLDPFDLLGVAESATPAEIGQAFAAFARRFAPWEFAGEASGKATTLLLAAARAYAALADAESRQEVLARRRPQPTVPVARPQPEADRIRTDLLDPEVQFAKGKALMDAGRHREAIVQLEYASDLDPQNPRYRVELAFCRFLHDPEWAAARALEELDEALRIERGYGLAYFYAGEIHRRLGNLEPARIFLEKAVKPMAGDRRPIDALRAMGASRG